MENCALSGQPRRAPDVMPARAAVSGLLPLARRRLLVTASASLAGAIMSAHADSYPASARPIQQLVDGLLQVMKAGSSTPFRDRFDKLAPVMDRVFDLDAILHQSVGVAWTSLTPGQQGVLQASFRRYTVVSYVSNFDNFGNQQFVVSPQTRMLSNGNQVVSTRIISAPGQSHQLDYVMRNAGGGWRAIDILADGAISRVAVQRSDFRHLLSRGGAAALSDSLNSKSLELSGGSV